jgi:serine/threonine-protein kinase
VHRDIKPGNVMLTRSGEVKVMDFGIARAVSDAQATMTQTAQVIGTAQYLSPEQARGERVDARSDLYSTGCLLYELLTGRPPFLGDSPVAIAYQHVRENPVPPSRLDPEIPRWADSIVLRAMAKDPAQRYQSAADMRTDIQRALSGVPVAAAPGYASTQRMAGGATMTAGPTRAIPGYQYGPEEEEDGYGGTGSRRRRTWLLWAIGAILVLAVLGGVAYAFFGGGGSGTAVPQVNGLPVAKAESQITAAGLKFTVHTKNSSTVAKGIVISTNPPNGNKVAAGTVVTLDVSGGPAKIKVSNVVGMQEAQAQSTLQQQQFNVKAVTDSASTKPQGTVVRQSPQAGTLRLPGTTVTIYVSGGGSAVPNVVGDPAATAQQILQSQGFIVQVNTVAGPAGALPGLVFHQSPAAGQNLAPGATVVIFVAAQPSPTPTTPTPTPTTPTPTPSPTST